MGNQTSVPDIPDKHCTCGYLSLNSYICLRCNSDINSDNYNICEICKTCYVQGTKCVCKKS